METIAQSQEPDSALTLNMEAPKAASLNRDTRHVFEHMGKAPYRYVGYERRVFTVPGTEIIRAGASCDHCSTAIVDCFIFRSADGKTFKVGSTCVNKSEDRGLINVVKRAAAQVATQRRHEVEAAKITGLAQQLAEGTRRDKLATLPHPKGYRDRETNKPLSFLDYAEWMFKNAGNAGKLKLLKQVEQVLQS